MNQLLFFAGLKDRLGKQEITMDVAGKSVQEIKKQLIKDLSLPDLQHTMVAINEEFADNDTLVNHGDTVAFIPPVSGG